MMRTVANGQIGRLPLVFQLLQGLYCILTLLLLLPEGSVKSLPLDLLAIPIFLLACLATIVARPAMHHRKIYGIAVALVGVLVIWSLIQAIGIVGNPLANPVWRQASEVLGPMAGSISVVPAETRATIIPVLLPFAVFSSGILLFQSDVSATRLLRIVAISGGVVALFGLIQYEFFPDYILFRKKEFYLHDLTSVLVNRNSMATYLGAALLLNAALLYDSLLPAGTARGLGGTVLYRQSHLRISWLSMIHGVMVFCTLVALLLTRSRAGTAATFIAFFALAGFFVLDGFRRIEQRTGRRSSGSVRFMRAMAVLAVSGMVTLIFAFLGGRVIMRADLQGFEDGRFCTYPSIVQLLTDNWIVGTGLGSFREAYARYQDSRCGNYLWDRAHSFYLEGWIDLGVVFVPMLLTVVLGLSIIFLSGLRRRKSLRWASATGLAILFLFVLHSIVDFSIQIPGVAVNFAAIMAGVAVISLNTSKRARATPRPGHLQGVAASG